MYYDRHGLMKAAGAEADGASVLAQAEDEGWIKTELFKLRLRPKTMTLKMNGMRLSPLPKGKTAVDVFGDFLSYLFRCTRSFIIDTHANGQALWHAVEHDLQFVLSHPNGWEGAQQMKMRRAAVYGGLIPDTDEGKARIRFVTEGEASLHACVLNGLAADVLSNPSGHGFIVADAGGGTLDISSYAIRGTQPLVIEEIAPPDCVFAGSVFVSRRARAFFEEKLRNSKYGTPDSLDHITKRFDETTKRLFRDNKEMQFVPFGSPLDKDQAAGIRVGQLKLTGLEVAALFEPSIQAAVTSIRNQIEASGGTIKSVWLVGGFAASPWLFSQLQEYLTPLGVVVSRPDTQTSKAVADGAIGFYCDHHVSARVSKFMYGVEYLREFDANDEEHLARKSRLFELPSGPKLLPDAFDCILSRGVKVKESTVFSRKYCTEVTNLSTLSVFEVEIWCYRGGDTIPKWILRNAENFSTLCYVRADLSPLAGSAQPKDGRNGKKYWTIVFSIEIHFGLTEFKARIKWQDNGKTRYGPASIVYNEGGHRADEDEADSLPDDDPSTYTNHRSDRHRSYTSSRAPSRDPMVSSSKPSTPTTYAPPHVEFPTKSSSSRRQSIDSGRTYDRDPSRIYDMRDRKISQTSSDNWRERERTPSAVDKGKSREIIPESLSRIGERDRLANLSAKSTDSKASTKSNATARLSEQLNSVWGPAGSAVPSKQPTPSASPLVEVTTVSAAPSTENKPASVVSSSKLATPQPASKAPTPKPAATPTVASKVATPQATSKAATPAISKAGTPQPATKSLSGWGDAPKAPTPALTSKVPTPAVSKTPSKAPTPWATSKAPTPRSLSKAGTPTVERAEPWPEVKPPTPKVEFDLPPEQSAAPAPQPSAAESTHAPVEDKHEPPAATGEHVAEHNHQETSSPAAAESRPAEPPTAPVVPASDLVNKSGGELEDWVNVDHQNKDGGTSNALLDNNASNNKPEGGGSGGMDDLWGADKTTEPGNFSDFLSSSAWDKGSGPAPAETKPEEKKETPGASTWGSGGGWGFGSSFGSASKDKGVSAFGSGGLGSTWGSSGESKPSVFGAWGSTTDNLLGFGTTSNEPENKESQQPPASPKPPVSSKPASPKPGADLKLDLAPVNLEAEASGATPATEAPSVPPTPGGEFTAPGKKKKKKGKGKGAAADKDEDDDNAKAEQEAKEKAEKEAKEKEEQEAKEKADKEKQEQEAREAEEKKKEEDGAKNTADEADASKTEGAAGTEASPKPDETAGDTVPPEAAPPADDKEDGDEDDADAAKAPDLSTPTASGAGGPKKKQQKKKGKKGR
ncbi:unnamed protein product [Somion occarium]